MNMQNLMAQAQKMQRDITAKKDELEKTEFTGKSEWVEVVFNAKLGQLKDNNDLIYDISNRQWSAEQYALKFFADTDTNAVRDLIRQTINLKK